MLSAVYIAKLILRVQCSIYATHCMAAHAYNSVCQGVEDSCDRLFYMQLQRDYGYYLHMFSEGSPILND